MTKREYLKSKGYHDSCISAKFHKLFIFENPAFFIDAYINVDFEEFYVEPYPVHCQKDIDALQIAFNNVKRDFKEMMKYED